MKNENIVINVPKSEASESAFHCEAQLERAFCQENKFNYETIDHQLPVRLFNGEIQEANAITPKGYLDIWSIKEDLLRIFELKLPTNTEIGIISELMFYVNVMTDVINGEIKIPFSSEDKSYRSFERLFNFQKNKEGKKIEGVFLADNFHPMIEEKKEEIKRILDDGYLGNGISELKVNFSFEKPKVNDYCPAYLEINEPKKNMSFKECQKSRQLKLLKKEVKLFEDAKGCGEFDHNMYPYVLQEKDRKKNLFKGIRDNVLTYFENNIIAWWHSKKGQNLPTGHLLSSQIHCLNHLFAFREDPVAVKTIIQNLIDLKIKTGLKIKEVLPSPLDTDGGYITFEFVCKNKTLLGEKHETRGANCTSVDAFVLAETENEKKILIPIEWKYTESYEKNDKNKADLSIVEERYTPLAKKENSNLGDWPDKFNWDPLYEFARQTLLMEQIKAKPEISGIDNVYDYIHIIVRPNENKEIINDIQRFKDFVKDEGRKKIIEVDPEELLNPLRSNDKYKDLFNYLETRYWK